MNTTIRLFTCGALCWAAFAAGAQETETDEAKELAEIPDARYAPDAFLARVEEAGGRVDFVFGDEAPFPQCHASSLVQAADGTLLSAFFAGTREKADDVGIWLSRFVEGDWTPVERVAKVNETAHWNPVLFRPEGDRIYLFFKVGPEIPYWQTYWMHSDDHGETWSAPEELVPGDEGGRGPVRSQPIVLSDGAWLAPASTELRGWKPFADRSEDEGETWTRTENWEMDRQVIRGLGAIQPTLWEAPEGTVHALLRTHAGFMAYSKSTDGGRTWSALEPTDLPNNNSGTDVLQLEDGRLLLAYNPQDENWGPRTPMTITVSEDNGETWTRFANLEGDPDADAEFSYPTLTRTDDGVALSYTYQRETVRVWQMPLEVFDAK